MASLILGHIFMYYYAIDVRQKIYFDQDFEFLSTDHYCFSQRTNNCNSMRLSLRFSPKIHTIELRDSR